MKNRVALTGTSRLKSMAPRFLVLWIVGSLAAVSVLLGCATGANPGAEETPAAVSTARGAGEESPGERGPGGESGSESGGVAGGTGSEEASGANLAPDETFEAVRRGARLVLNYDGASNAFTGTVKNTTAGILGNVRIEVHLSNGTELGPTTPVDLAPGQVMDINLPSTTAAFTGWIAHAEVGSGAEGSQAGGEASGGESRPDCPECPESGAAGNEAAREAAMSSPIIPLDQSWEGVLGGLAISANFDAATGSAHATVTNSTEQKLCYVQAEPHLKSGTQTVGELGPDMLGDLSPGQQAISGVSVDTEPGLAGVAFDGYVVHMEVFDCGGPGPQGTIGHARGWARATASPQPLGLSRVPRSVAWTLYDSKVS